MKFPNLISIHAPCTGSDDDASPVGLRDGDFNPRSLHGERPPPTPAATLPAIISIHAPCTGSDIDPLTNVAISCDFNPRSLHGERPAKRTKCREGADFNPRSLHGERPRQRVTPPNAKGISIHAPCTGSDDSIIDYQSAGFAISIHAPCTGSDHVVQRGSHGASISIHAPCTGSDINRMFEKNMGKIFQSTLPARGATCRKINGFRIYPHFNPRSLHGERQNDTVRIPSL